LYNLSSNQHEYLRTLLEEIRNHLTVVKGVIQISAKKPMDKQQENLIEEAIEYTDTLTNEALNILISLNMN